MNRDRSAYALHSPLNGGGIGVERPRPCQIVKRRPADAVRDPRAQRDFLPLRRESGKDLRLSRNPGSDYYSRSHARLLASLVSPYLHCAGSVFSAEFETRARESFGALPALRLFNGGRRSGEFLFGARVPRRDLGPPVVSECAVGVGSACFQGPSDLYSKGRPEHERVKC
jgi:hypothetical protein